MLDFQFVKMFLSSSRSRNTDYVNFSIPITDMRKMVAVIGSRRLVYIVQFALLFYHNSSSFQFIIQAL